MKQSGNGKEGRDGRVTEREKGIVVVAAGVSFPKAWVQAVSGIVSSMGMGMWMALMNSESGGEALASSLLRFLLKTSIRTAEHLKRNNGLY